MLAAMMAKRRSWLYLSGTLASAISIMMVMRLGTWFFGGRALMFQVRSLDTHAAGHVACLAKLAAITLENTIMHPRPRTCGEHVVRHLRTLRNQVPGRTGLDIACLLAG